jgi:hypothetical protein
VGGLRGTPLDHCLAATLVPEAAPFVAGRPHSEDFRWSRRGKPQFLHSVEPPYADVRGVVETGDGAMWIVMYVAMIASLSAMGLAPSLVPLPVDKDQLPHDEA